MRPIDAEEYKVPPVNWSAKLLLDLYRVMVAIRQAEESFVPVILDGTIRCPVHLYTGQEAVAAGVCAHLDERDYILGSHRSHGHFLAKGGTIAKLVAEVYCRETGCSRGRGGSMHLIDIDKGMLGAAPIVGGTISLALGAALAAAIRKDGRVAVTFFGDGATGEGVLYESMNFAAVRKLPIIFVCENNLYSTHMPIREIRVASRIAEMGTPLGIPSHTLDGNDVVEVYEAAREAVAHCRSGQGPVFLEFLTYRMRGHVGPNDNIQGTQTDIRPADEIDHWRSRDPIARFEAFALQTGRVTPEEFAAVHAAVADEVAHAHRLAAAGAWPSENEVGEYVFAG